MAGHSKWSKVKQIKGPFGIKRDAASGKLVKEFTGTGDVGWDDPSGTPGCAR